jgi:hypothetical protein
MKPGNYPLTLRKGQSLDITMAWRGKNGNLVDLAGCLVRMDLLASLDDTFPLAQFSDLGGGSLNIDEDDLIHLTMDTGLTDAPFWDSVGAYRMSVIQTNGEIVDLLEGSVIRL